MPLLKFITNVPESHMACDLELKLSSKLKECISQWKEQYFTVWLLPGQRIIRGRDNSPNAIIEIYCCAAFYDAEINRKITRLLIEFGSNELGIQQDRMSVLLYRPRTDCVGLANGTLVSDLVSEQSSQTLPTWE
ncbi:uncharacterized protein LOC119740440 [Patiria miniata]|uniref:L-dopachrome isomerase n=1 Tax=Patiria miniata TaxID=46514 RepID=A0A914B8C7_PATMI|nr:uncharacterized protein LOC119718760 [Patiria miniata]XP_038071682.1 uncharacterized protein LOC119740440 [Patiria miniata]